MIKEFWTLLLCVILCACTRADESSSDGNERAVNYKTLQNKNGILYSSDGKSLFNGVCESFYDGGLRRDKIQVKDGKWNGLMTIWHPNGQTFRTVCYENGEKHGKQTEWDEEGRIRSETYFKHGIKHGLDSEWHENGKKSKETNFDNGVEHGTNTEWYVDGQKSREVHLIHGKANGLASRWYSDGLKASEFTFANGALHGTCTEWHRDGTTRAEYFYENGKKTGTRIPTMTQDAEDGGGRPRGLAPRETDDNQSEGNEREEEYVADANSIPEYEQLQKAKWVTDLPPAFESVLVKGKTDNLDSILYSEGMPKDLANALAGKIALLSKGFQTIHHGVGENRWRTFNAGIHEGKRLRYLIYPTHFMVFSVFDKAGPPTELTFGLALTGDGIKIVGMKYADIDTKNKAEQDGTGQPSTRTESKSEGRDKPQPESEGRSR